MHKFFRKLRFWGYRDPYKDGLRFGRNEDLSSLERWIEYDRDFCGPNEFRRGMEAAFRERTRGLTQELTQERA